MNAIELDAEVPHRQASCRRTFADSLAGYRGPRLDTPRGHLLARIDAARRVFARRGDHSAEIELVQAEAALEAFDERAAGDGGTCPDCKWPLNTEDHPCGPCGRPAICSLCEGPVEPEQTRPLCRRCEGTCSAHARLEQARIDEEQGS